MVKVLWLITEICRLLAVSYTHLVNNPGKYERYKPFTGLDEPVISFLEEDGEILRFLDSVYALVDASVKQMCIRDSYKGKVSLSLLPSSSLPCVRQSDLFH